MKTYRVQVLGFRPQGWTNDDVLAVLVSTVSSKHEVDRCEVRDLNKGSGLIRALAVFKAASDDEARVLGAAAQRGISGSTDLIVERRDRKYTRLTT